MKVVKESSARPPNRPMPPDLLASIQPARQAAARLKQPVGRFDLYDLLEAIYRIYVDWKKRKVAKRSTRLITDGLAIERRKGMTPIRVLIEATIPRANFKQKSRWVRAIEYIYSEDVSPSKFSKFVRSRGGIAGCARLAVDVSRKRRRPGGDWDD
jgi:hypothetical protein